MSQLASMIPKYTVDSLHSAWINGYSTFLLNSYCFDCLYMINCGEDILF